MPPDTIISEHYQGAAGSHYVDHYQSDPALPGYRFDFEYIRPLIQRRDALTSLATVGRVRKRYAERGCIGATEHSRRSASTLASSMGPPSAARPDRLLARSRQRVRSTRLLADRMVELGHVEAVSHETVRRTLKKTRSGPGRASSG